MLTTTQLVGLTFAAGFVCGVAALGALLMFWQDSALRKAWASQAQAQKLERLTAAAYDDATSFRKRATDLLFQAQFTLNTARAGAAKLARGRARAASATIGRGQR